MRFVLYKDFRKKIVKTPTSTQHNPKTTSNVVGFDVNITLQPPPTPTTDHHPPPKLNSGCVEPPWQGKLTQSLTIILHYLRQPSSTILDYLRLS